VLDGVTFFLIGMGWQFSSLLPLLERVRNFSLFPFPYRYRCSSRKRIVDFSCFLRVVDALILSAMAPSFLSFPFKARVDLRHDFSWVRRRLCRHCFLFLSFPLFFPLFLKQAIPFFRLRLGMTALFLSFPSPWN